MKKGVSYLVVALIIALGIVILYYWGGTPTGYAVLSEYGNQTVCESAGYTWENLTNQSCTNVTTCVNQTINCEPCLGYEDINGTQGNCINWTSCVNESCSTEENCTLVVIGGKCIGDVCDSDNLDLCLTEAGCTDAGGYWYDNICNAEEQPSCSNDLDLCEDETNCTDAGGYWYDDSCNIKEEEEENVSEEESTIQIQVIPIIPAFELSAADISDISLTAGSSQEILWSVSNTGGILLSACSVKPFGDYASWIVVSEDVLNLGSGEEGVFAFSVLLPEETETGSYLLNVSVECAEAAVSKDFTVDVVKKKLEFDLISADRTRKDRVRVIYSLRELSGEYQDVKLDFSLLNENNQEVANASENRSLDANASEEFSTNVRINESLLPVNETTNETIESELTLVVNFNSQIYSSSVMEKITLGTPIGGFAILGGIGTGEAIIFVVVLIVLIFIFIFARRMRKKGKTLKDLFRGKGSE